jgi:hypothetical protein
LKNWTAKVKKESRNIKPDLNILKEKAFLGAKKKI